jgi:predicted Zn-dependent protease
MIADVTGLLTMSFNQLNEAEADLYGIDLALATGFNPCHGIEFWDRMSGQEGEASEWKNLLRTHPYSTRRANCYRTHLAEAHIHPCR